MELALQNTHLVAEDNKLVLVVGRRYEAQEVFVHLAS
jgi:hypothetical protein